MGKAITKKAGRLKRCFGSDERSPSTKHYFACMSLGKTKARFVESRDVFFHPNGGGHFFRFLVVATFSGGDRWDLRSSWQRNCTHGQLNNLVIPIGDKIPLACVAFF